MRTEQGAHPDDGYSSPVAPVERPSGRRIPRAGWIGLAMLVVAAGSVVVGTQAGGPARVPLPTLTATSGALAGTARPPSATASPSTSSAATSQSAILPPASSLSLERALVTARQAFLGSSARIVAAQVVRYGDISRSNMGAPDAWVWVFTARGAFSFASCGGRTATPYPCPSPATSARVIIDFSTGAFIEAVVPAPP